MHDNHPMNNKIDTNYNNDEVTVLLLCKIKQREKRWKYTNDPQYSGES